MTTLIPVIPVSERHGFDHFDDCVFDSGVDLANVACGGCKPATWAEGNELRIASGDPIPAANPTYLALAFKVRYGWDVPPFSGPQTALMDAIRGGKWGAVHFYYNLWPYALKIQKDFNGGHCMLVGPTDLNGNRKPGFFWIIDPLFFPGSGYIGQWVLESTIVTALHGSLANLVTPNQFTVPTHPPNPHVRCLLPTFTGYTVKTISQSPLVLRATGGGPRPVVVGTIIPVSMREYPVTMGDGSTLPLREIASGPYAGQFLWSHGATPFSL